MRNNLLPHLGKTKKFTALLVKRSEFHADKVLLKDIRFEGKQVSDHMWVSARAFRDVKDNTIVVFVGMVETYTKGSSSTGRWKARSIDLCINRIKTICTYKVNKKRGGKSK